MSDPKDDAALWDFMQRRWGWGSWWEGGNKPWHKYRVEEISKLKRVRMKRKVTIPELMRASEHCQRQGIYVRNVFVLFDHLYDAMRYAREQEKASAAAQVDDLLAAAIFRERELAGPDSPWISRLVRASDKGEVLAEWRKERGM